jgi:hypothetical protein
MTRFGIILGLLLQSLIAICCGNFLSPQADGCCGTADSCCCCAAQDSAGSGCSTPDEVDPCGASTHKQPQNSGCECCIVGQETPQAPAEPARRYSGDFVGVVIPPAADSVDFGSGVREPSSLALRHEPPWPSGRAMLADQCRWNL